MTIQRCDLPPQSELDRRWLESAWFRDAYRAPLRQPKASRVEIFFAFFARHPWWVKGLLMLRNRIANWCGLDASTAAEIMRVRRGGDHHVGDKNRPLAQLRDE